MRSPLNALHRRYFDAAVIGAGVNGASAAQHLAARGYSVILLDKGDFASGSSGRSSRLLHCGLRYLAPGASMWEFVRHPGRFTTACRMARQAMLCREQFVKTTPGRLRPYKFSFPVYDDSPYAAWQLDAAFRLLGALGGRGIPLDYRRLSPAQAASTPLLEHLRDKDRLKAIAMFREYQFDWPERIVVDTVLDAEHLGAVVRNYTAVASLTRAGKQWSLALHDMLDSAAADAEVKAGAVFNMAGIWIDGVGQSITGQKPPRRITGTKGSHIAVRLPEDCADYGIVTLNRIKQPFYCVPWRGLHYFGPTETLYDGDPDDIHPTEDEFAFLLDEANHLLPGLGLRREHVLYGWSGVRPLTYAEDQPMGARSRELHDFSEQGLPGLYAMTAGPVMTHRSAGEEVARTMARRTGPSGTPGSLCYGARTPPQDQDSSPPLLNDDPTVRLVDVRRAVREEYGQCLADVMFRRTGAGWSATMGREGARVAADIMAEELGWSCKRTDQEVDDYIAHLEHQYALSPAQG